MNQSQMSVQVPLQETGWSLPAKANFSRTASASPGSLTAKQWSVEVETSQQENRAQNSGCFLKEVVPAHRRPRAATPGAHRKPLALSSSVHGSGDSASVGQSFGHGVASNSLSEGDGGVESSGSPIFGRPRSNAFDFDDLATQEAIRAGCLGNQEQPSNKPSKRRVSLGHAAVQVATHSKRWLVKQACAAKPLAWRSAVCCLRGLRHMAFLLFVGGYTVASRAWNVVLPRIRLVSEWACGPGSAIAILFLLVAKILVQNHFGEAEYCRRTAFRWNMPGTWPHFFLAFLVLKAMRKSVQRIKFVGPLLARIMHQPILTPGALLAGGATLIGLLVVFLVEAGVWRWVDGVILDKSTSWPQLEAVSISKFHCPPDQTIGGVIPSEAITAAHFFLEIALVGPIGRSRAASRPLGWSYTDAKQVGASFFRVSAHWSWRVMFLLADFVTSCMVIWALASRTSMHLYAAMGSGMILACFPVGLCRRYMGKRCIRLTLAADVPLECPICWDSALSATDVVVLTPCGHIRCKGCTQDINMDPKQGKHCHVCRMKINQALCM